MPREEPLSWTASLAQGAHGPASGLLGPASGASGVLSPGGRGVLSPDGRGMLSPDGRGIFSPDGRGGVSPDVRGVLSPTAIAGRWDGFKGLSFGDAPPEPRFDQTGQNIAHQTGQNAAEALATHALGSADAPPGWARFDESGQNVDEAGQHGPEGGAGFVSLPVAPVGLLDSAGNLGASDGYAGDSAVSDGYAGNSGVDGYAGNSGVDGYAGNFGVSDGYAGNVDGVDGSEAGLEDTDETHPEADHPEGGNTALFSPTVVNLQADALDMSSLSALEEDQEQDPQAPLPVVLSPETKL
ncbi:hypothetical protein T484DRAFT_1807258 [Baffinella frigidus]|nr:hypothetical protein T484DRAFT_1807258 [Cryptophyta sp. CCMP2293]